MSKPIFNSANKYCRSFMKFCYSQKSCSSCELAINDLSSYDCCYDKFVAFKKKTYPKTTDGTISSTIENEQPK